MNLRLVHYIPFDRHVILGLQVVKGGFDNSFISFKVVVGNLHFPDSDLCGAVLFAEFGDFLLELVLNVVGFLLRGLEFGLLHGA